MAELNLNTPFNPLNHDVAPEEISFDDQNEQKNSKVLVTVDFTHGSSVSTSFEVKRKGCMKDIFDGALTRFKKNHQLELQGDDYMLVVRGSPAVFITTQFSPFFSLPSTLGVVLEQKISSNAHVNLCHALQLPISFQFVAKASAATSRTGSSASDLNANASSVPISTYSTTTATATGMKSGHKVQKAFPLSFSFQGKKNMFSFFKPKSEGQSTQDKSPTIQVQSSPCIAPRSSHHDSLPLSTKTTSHQQGHLSVKPQTHSTSSSDLDSPTSELIRPPSQLNTLHKESWHSEGSLNAIHRDPIHASPDMGPPSAPSAPSPPIQISVNIPAKSPSPAFTVNSATITQQMNPQNFLVRVFLDADATTLVSCPPDATVSFLIEKVRKKYLNLNRGNTLRAGVPTLPTPPSNLEMFLIDENYEVVHQTEQELIFLNTVKSSIRSKNTPTFVLLPKEMDPSCTYPMVPSELGSPTPYFAFLKLPKGLFTYFRIYSLMSVNQLAERAAMKLQMALDLFLITSELQVSLSSNTLSETLKFPLSHTVLLVDLGLKSICDPYSSFVMFKVSAPSRSLMVEEKAVGMDINLLFRASHHEEPSEFQPPNPPLFTHQEPFQINLNLAPDINAQFYVSPSSPCSVLVEEARLRLRSLSGIEPKQASMYQLFFDWNGALRVLNFTDLIGEIHGLQSLLDRGDTPTFMLRLHPESAQKPNPGSEETKQNDVSSIKSADGGDMKNEASVLDSEALQKKSRIITPEDVVRNLQLMEGVHLQRKMDAELEKKEVVGSGGKVEVKTVEDPFLPPSTSSSLFITDLTAPPYISVKKHLHPSFVRVYLQDLKEPFTFPCSPYNTVGEVKAMVFNHETIQQQKLKFTTSLPSNYFFLCERKDTKEDPLLLVDDAQWLHCISYVENTHPDVLFLNLVEKPPLDPETQERLSTILGYPWSDLDTLDDPEVQLLRLRLRNLHFYVPLPKDFTYSVDTTPLSPVLISKLICTRFRIQLRLHFPAIKASKTLVCDAHESVKSVVQRVIGKFELSLEATTSTLKWCGREGYLHPSHHVIDHTWIRQAILNDDKINLIVVQEPRSVSLSSLSLRDNQSWIDRPFQVEETPKAPGTHPELTLKGRDLASVHCISLWDLFSNLRVEIKKIENLVSPVLNSMDSLFIESYVSFGNKPISSSVRTHFFPISLLPRLQTYLVFDLPISNIPRNAQLTLTLYATASSTTIRRKVDGDKKLDIVLVGTHQLALLDFRGHLRQGVCAFPLTKPSSVPTPGAAALAIPLPASLAPVCPTVTIKFEEYSHPVVFPAWPAPKRTGSTAKAFKDIQKDDAIALQRILKHDGLTVLDEFSKSLLWKWREWLVGIPASLPKVLLSVAWNSVESVGQVKNLLAEYGSVSPETAFLLLEKRFANEDVRAFAVKVLDGLSHEEVRLYLIQLIQALSFESRLDSMLARFTLKRALASTEIGHAFFWALRSELDKPSVSILYSILLEAYFLNRPHLLPLYASQVRVVQTLSEVAKEVPQQRSVDRPAYLTQQLRTRVHVQGARLPFAPAWEVQAWVLEKSKCMDSKKSPLWLVCQGAEFADDTGEVAVLFKCGDDLRQDMLTLQMLQVMDRIWKSTVGLDLKLSIYDCVGTGRDQGFIHVIPDAETVSSIQLAYGGSTAAFKEEPLAHWIKAKNPTSYDDAVMNFTLSCAGYCVATYCLGIGDRHNDNIMCTHRGHLFHIDFGHFLGNIKRKFGFKREIAPFVLTPDFLYVITSSSNKENFNFFVSTCVKAFIALRRQSALILHLFMLMCNSGIPELASYEDIQYLRDSFCLGLSEADAAVEFQNLILLSIRLGWSTQLNWWVHNLVHPK